MPALPSNAPAVLFGVIIAETNAQDKHRRTNWDIATLSPQMDHDLMISGEYAVEQLKCFTRSSPLFVRKEPNSSCESS
ncbi:MAG TPA: hypothetical protein VKB76_07025, partial [Ktedonobacterales bacterium]|nr:hypothetical protein [Ktedonobacterales bacterium]